MEPPPAEKKNRIGAPEKPTSPENLEEAEQEEEEEEYEEWDEEMELYLYKWDEEASWIITEYTFEKKIDEDKEQIDENESKEKEELKVEAKSVDVNNKSAVEGDEKKGETNQMKGDSAQEEGEEEEPEEYEFIDLSKEGPTVVEFYAPWCPHCQDFKPHYIELAAEVNRRAVNTEVNFFAVSCEAHPNACITYQVDGYPSVRGFTEGQISDLSHEDYKGLEMFEDGGRDLDADLVAELLGIELVIEEKNVTAPEEFLNSTDLLAYQQSMAEAAEEAAIERVEKHEYPRPIHEVYYDAGRSLVSLLQKHVFTSPGALPDDRKSALSDWINLLSWALPDEWDLQRTLISNMKRDIQSISQSKKNLINLLDQHKASSYGIPDFSGEFAKHVPNKDGSSFSSRKWSYQCSHGKPGFGFTCGLWELFHIVTVGASERHFDGFKRGEIVGTHYVAQALRNFIENFFACEVCRRNFLNMYDECGYDHCMRLTTGFPSDSDAKDLAMWLWEVHNGVNLRIMSESAQRNGRTVTKEELEAAWWPTLEMCRACWREDGTWDENVVYAFLKKQYWPSNQDQNIDFSSINSWRNDAKTWQNFVALLLPLGVLSATLLQRWLFKRSLANSGRHKKFEDQSDGNCHGKGYFNRFLLRKSI